MKNLLCWRIRPRGRNRQKKLWENVKVERRNRDRSLSRKTMHKIQMCFGLNGSSFVNYYTSSIISYLRIMSQQIRHTLYLCKSYKQIGVECRYISGLWETIFDIFHSCFWGNKKNPKVFQPISCFLEFSVLITWGSSPLCNTHRRKRSV